MSLLTEVLVPKLPVLRGGISPQDGITGKNPLEGISKGSWYEDEVAPQFVPVEGVHYLLRADGRGDKFGDKGRKKVEEYWDLFSQRDDVSQGPEEWLGDQLRQDGGSEDPRWKKLAAESLDRRSREKERVIRVRQFREDNQKEGQRWKKVIETPGANTYVQSMRVMKAESQMEKAIVDEKVEDKKVIERAMGIMVNAMITALTGENPKQQWRKVVRLPRARAMVRQADSEVKAKQEAVRLMSTTSGSVGEAKENNGLPVENFSGKKNDGFKKKPESSEVETTGGEISTSIGNDGEAMTEINQQNLDGTFIEEKRQELKKVWASQKKGVEPIQKKRGESLGDMMLEDGSGNQVEGYIPEATNLNTLPAENFEFGKGEKSPDTGQTDTINIRLLKKRMEELLRTYDALQDDVPSSMMLDGESLDGSTFRLNVEERPEITQPVTNLDLLEKKGIELEAFPDRALNGEMFEFTMSEEVEEEEIQQIGVVGKVFNFWRSALGQMIGDVDRDVVRVVEPVVKEGHESIGQAMNTIAIGMLGSLDDIRYRTRRWLRKKEVRQGAVIVVALLLPTVLALILDGRHYQEVRLGNIDGILADFANLSRLLRGGN